MLVPKKIIQNTVGIKGSTFVSFLIKAKEFKTTLE